MVTESIRLTIQNQYRAWLGETGRAPRLVQKQMIAAIARTLQSASEGNTNSLLVQAETGTGKTLAYLLAAIPFAQHHEKTLVISTATTALQSQLMEKDLPDLAKHGGLSFKYALAKGRKRWLCLSKLESRLRMGAKIRSKEALMFESAEPLSEQELESLDHMMEAYAEGDWQGDLDAWDEPLEPAVLNQVSTDHMQCSGRACSNISRCAYYQARDSWQKVDVIIANHDLVLADLALGGGAVLPEPEKCIYVFDEGHHLPDKAVSQAHTAVRLLSMGDALKGDIKDCQRLVKTHSGKNLSLLHELMADVELLIGRLEEAYAFFTQFKDVTRLLEDQDSHEGERLRLTQSDLEPWQETCLGLLDRTKPLLGCLELLRDPDTGPNLGEIGGSLLGRIEGRIQKLSGLMQGLTRPQPPANQPPWAYWLRAVGAQQDLEINASPVRASESLQAWLWQRAFAVIVTSATLESLGDFSVWQQKAGIEQTDHCLLPMPWSLEGRVQARIPKGFPSPKQVEAHTEAIIDALPALISEQKGSLVLFASRRQLEAVWSGLDEQIKSLVLKQTSSLSKSELIRLHAEALEEGGSSVLFGLASFAEGVDLPGHLCEHVIITKLPFAVPDNPVEEALYEWVEANGGRPFMDISVPEVCIKMKQACGRLIRNEKDQGLITILDPRMVTTGYGRKITQSLPIADFVSTASLPLPQAEVS